MRGLLRGHLGALVLMLLLDTPRGQEFGEDCLAQFKEGRENFILDADESVKDGATFVSSPLLTLDKDCAVACCKDPRCNVAFMEKVDEEGTINACFLFDCLYKQKYVCRFVTKKGYSSYIMDSVYESYLKVDVPPNDSDHPPVANGGQDRVVQPWDSVTLSGVESKDDQKIESFQWQMLTPYPYAVIEKTNFDDEITVSNLTSGVYKFQLTVTDTTDQSDSTRVTVLVLTPEQSEHHCMAPKKVGPCRGSFPRWHYNAASEKCEKFTFGGCRENLNNYLSEDECEKACTGSEKGKSGRFLPVPEPQGEKCGAPCAANEFTCENGCCLNPGLECDSKPQCSDGSDEMKCEYLGDKFRKLLDLPVNEQKVRCTEIPRTGTCRDRFSKWYYDPIKQDCFLFNYGGCEGNENRFDTHETCTKFCRGVTEKDVYTRNEEHHSKLEGAKIGNLAIAIVLAVAILILIGVLVYCFMKGRKSSRHQRVPVNTVPVSFEDREHLVYNSTTKSI